MKRTNFDLIVMNVKFIRSGIKKNPLLYTDHEIDDTLEAVEEFFENASIEVSYLEVERIAKELNDTGYSYFSDRFLFNLT